MNRRTLEQSLGRHVYTRGPARLRDAALRLAHHADANNIQATAFAVLVAIRPGRSRTVPVAILAVLAVEVARIGGYVHDFDPNIDGVCPECRVPASALSRRSIPAAPARQPEFDLAQPGMDFPETETDSESECFDLELRFSLETWTAGEEL